VAIPCLSSSTTISIRYALSFFWWGGKGGLSVTNYEGGGGQLKVTGCDKGGGGKIYKKHDIMMNGP